MDGNSMQLLKNLFDQCQKDENSSDSEDDEGVNVSLGPGDITSIKSKIINTLENPLMKKIDGGTSVRIKSMEEFEQAQKCDEELLDSRLQPEYSIAYKQSVTTEDIYLQFGLKTAMSSSCEDMVIEIKLPDESVGIDQMQLNTENDKIELSTTVYYLKLMLPQKIHPQKGRAEYDSTKKLLKLTLRMDREYDFVNF